MTGPTLRAATVDDLPGIAAVAAETWRAHYPGVISSEQIEYMLARQYALAVLARELTAEGIRYACVESGPRSLIAFAAWSPAGPGVAKLHKLYVLPAHQHAGHGARLLTDVEAQARAAGHSTVTLNVNKRNAAAVAFYERRGYRRARATVIDIGGGFVMDDYVMERSVGPT